MGGLFREKKTRGDKANRGTDQNLRHAARGDEKGVRLTK